MDNKTLDVKQLMNPDGIGTQIANIYQTWNMQRNNWLNEKRELRNFLFATDTRKTSNSKLPWKNSTTLPKLCQIRDNLHANYMAALFPNSDWLTWEGSTVESVAKQKAKVIKAFVENKVDNSDYKETISQVALDWIDYGNAFGYVDYVDETTKGVSGEEFPGYKGPKLFRISPLDIVFDPTAVSFRKSPKIIRTLKTLGSLKKESLSYVDQATAKKAFERAREIRGVMTNISVADSLKDNGFQVDGFGSYVEYFNSGMVEVLEFYGDLYDVENDKLYENYVFTVMDRGFILKMEPNTNWLGRDNFFHIGWRKRPDNLYAMGPLDNLVGMQYRIDHLENLKADAFDLVAFPMMKIKGEVEEFDYAPGNRIYVGDEGDVEFMHPDVAALNADNQIALLEQKMEDLAGAPKQAMGIRTPGEKTAYEVQTLENGAGRIFQNKTLMFEDGFIKPTLNSYLEIGIRKMPITDVIPIYDDEIDVVTFSTITKADLQADGVLRPVGASHFAKKALLVQNLTQMLASPIGQDPAINIHISGIALAQMMEQVLELDKFKLVSPNIRVFEQMDTHRLMQQGAEQMDTEAATASGVTEGDSDPNAPMPQQGPPAQ